ncbi:response regulator [Anaerocolumna sp. AGMB13025]|uniref:response regulator n=1 Tax=Anaerocolumna sp. AGMB13025 TaxID=3039116 RepID=UPI00241C7D8B|nr:response regulator [Anaerocolumna sp. AGMB13025]WFR58387.1 response regulator [Anaerocolumna sp. AGMB13025]
MDITAILVDDERLALKIMDIMLQKYPQIKIIGQYTNPIQAIEDIKLLKPNFVILDIDMPCMNGMEAAERILEESPGTQIVFVTAYEEYALKAYEFHPMDYLLKPVEEKRLDKLVSYLINKISIVKYIPEKKLLIRCFGDFCIKWEDQEPIKFRTEKTREIFAYLVDHYNQKVDKDEMLDSLWPEENPEKAIKQLYNGIYYIRRALYEYGIRDNQMMIAGDYQLILKNVDLDLLQIKDLNQCSEEDLEDKIKLFQGLYFGKLDYVWLQLKREEYLLLYQKNLLKLISLYTTDNQYEQAERLLLKAFHEDYINETIVEALLKLYLKLQNKTKGIRIYQSYQIALREELNEHPSKIIKEYYNKLKRL